jgi:hypothetical protein
MGSARTSPSAWSEALRERFGFETPDSFRLLESHHLFKWSKRFRNSDLTKPGNRYLGFNDMEWYQPEELRAFRFKSYHKPGFVPFAHTGGDDYWCWFPQMKDSGGIPVVLCSRDCCMGDLYAPDFAGALYRQALEYSAQTAIDDTEPVGAMLRRFAVDLSAVWPKRWTERIRRAADDPPDWSQYEAEISSEFGKQYVVPFQVPWMEPI